MGEVFKTIFSFDGRFGRKEYWTVQISILAGAAVLMMGYIQIFKSLVGEGVGMLVGALIVIGFAVFTSLATQVKRWHDLNRSGLWVLIGIVPYIGGLYALIMLGFVKGDEGANNYGIAVDQQLPENSYL